MLAYILPPEGKARVYNPTNGRCFSLREMQSAVGGLVESIPIGDYLMLLDEEGKHKDKPLNPRATKLLHLAGGDESDFIVGDVLVCDRGAVR